MANNPFHARFARAFTPHRNEPAAASVKQQNPQSPGGGNRDSGSTHWPNFTSVSSLTSLGSAIQGVKSINNLTGLSGQSAELANVKSSGSLGRQDSYAFLEVFFDYSSGGGRERVNSEGLGRGERDREGEGNKDKGNEGGKIRKEEEVRGGDERSDGWCQRRLERSDSKSSILHS